MTAPAYDWDGRWLKPFPRQPPQPGHTLLLCCHHAGGSAGMFRRWAGRLSATITPVGVQLPGRADRFLEEPYHRMEALTADLADVLLALGDRRFALYGVSMGARVVWQLTRTLLALGRPMPAGLFLACDPAPALDTGSWPWDDHDTEEFVRGLGGTPPEVLAQRDLFEALLPMMRADLDVLSSQRLASGTALPVPLRAFAGSRDASVPPERMSGWEAETSAGFRLRVLDSGHFFDEAAEDALIDEIAAELSPGPVRAWPPA